ncbi:GNAT family N-acetyltransferase [Niveibacterium sp. 24ML]|uniref:GNAT family N-acetyltransferase n=1 Tax=Niveibacterium sp. 24ML TaxID=2985512 RepID=UPI002270E373|nr:GNAT family N-acetyltransferase [Niveibacterium sp. 24ML]MCX9158014.1 GNAT family N-acetyltransferase [Niveibacterium sp. 24ML]
MSQSLIVRPLCNSDDLIALTHEVIRAGYASQAARGLRYWATHQSPEDTAKRFASGHGLIAEIDGHLVGTITTRPPQPDSSVALYRNPNTWTLCQFAVAPKFKAQGIGSALHSAALALAHEHGAIVMAIDTAEPAADVIAMYSRWGYVQVGMHDWRPQTNYVSVVMQRSI